MSAQIAKTITQLDSVRAYNDTFGFPTKHPLVAVVDFSKAARQLTYYSLNYGIYALFLKRFKCGELRYGRSVYDYQEGTVTSFAPGQVVEGIITPGQPVSCLGLLFHPDLIKGTPLSAGMRRYGFFSYSSNEALHLSEEERGLFADCLGRIAAEIDRPSDSSSLRIIVNNIELLLEYCLRFYERQFVTRSECNRGVLERFEQLLNEYFAGNRPQQEGLPMVKYFADKVCLSPNYFGDLVKKETGVSAQEYISKYVLDRAKNLLIGTTETVNQISYELGFRYSSHFNRFFKRYTGFTPVKYRQHA